MHLINSIDLPYVFTTIHLHKHNSPGLRGGGRQEQPAAQEQPQQQDVEATEAHGARAHQGAPGEYVGCRRVGVYMDAPMH